MPRSSPDARRALLARSPLFAALAPPDLERMLGLVRARRLAEDQVLCQRGETADAVYAIVSGRVRVVSTSDEGKEVVLRILRAGDVFGELGLLAGGHRTATVIAAEETELASIGRREFFELLEGEPGVAIRLLAVLAEQMGDLTDQLTDFVFHGLPVRLAKRLVELARTDGRETLDGVHIETKLSQQDLANLVGTSRESVNKQLRAWEDDGFIRHDKGELVILRLDELCEIAGDAEG